MGDEGCETERDKGVNVGERKDEEVVFKGTIRGNIWRRVDSIELYIRRVSVFKLLIL